MDAHPEGKPVEELIPERPTVDRLNGSAAGCRACDLWRPATQTVFGEGRPSARVVLVGEQPGDREDREGRPFIGPAGALLDKALEEAGIDRGDAYVTNVVKHFRFEERGKRRIHKKPSAEQIATCRPWLDAELAVLKPQALVCLGATAAQALFGRGYRVTKQRGQPFDSPLAPFATATVHPSSILRAPDEDARRREREAFVEDLRTVARAIEKS